MAEFINPYQFLPIAEGDRLEDLTVAKFDAGNVGHVTHASFVQGTYSGRVVCRIETKDSVVIGGEQDSSESPTVVQPYELHDRPAIPASTLRGLFSSLAEAASNSALRVLSNTLFSVRSAMGEFLPLVGIIVVLPNGQRQIRPLTLGPLTPNADMKSAAIPRKYRAIFADPHAHCGHGFLKVYLNGYRKAEGANGPQLAFVPGSFLDRNRGIDSAGADHCSEFWYLKLAGACSVSADGASIQSGEPYIKTVGQSDKQTHWLLGQRAAEGVSPIPESEWKEKPPAEQAQYTRGLLRILGLPAGRESELPPTRKHELFIPYTPAMESHPSIGIPNDVWETFHVLADQRTEADEDLPFSLQGSRRNDESDPEDKRIRLRDGDLVYFDVTDDAKPAVRAISLSSIWRQQAGWCHDFFSQAFGSEMLPFHPQRETISLAEQLFGFVEHRSKDEDADGQARALMGRLRFSAAELHPDAPTDYFDEYREESARVLRILSSPKPPSPNFYFDKRSSHGSRYIGKSELKPGSHAPKGRKVYVHRRNAGDDVKRWYTHPEKVADDVDQKVRVHPLRRGLEFYFHIDFENLSPRELSLLVYTLRPTREFLHKIGLGKPLGLGAVSVCPQGIFYIDRRRRYAQDVPVLGAARYHAACLMPEETLPERIYPREHAAAELSADGFPDWQSLAALAQELVPETIHQAFRTVGEPDFVKHDVLIPLVEGGEPEIDTYLWWVANDHKDLPEDQRQTLEPVPTEGTLRLPRLRSHERPT